MSYSALATNMNGDIGHDNHGNGDVTQSNHGDGDSVDKELDWLIDKTEDTKKPDGTKLDSDVNADGDFLPRTASPEPADRSDLPPRASSPQNGEPGDDPYSRAPSRLEADEDQDDYELTDEQREAELLLQKMREEGSFPTEDPPEYDVTERIKQLNEELAKEGEIEEKKDRKVGFKEVIEEVPPESDEEGEEEKQNETEKNPESDNQEKMKDLNLDDNESEKHDSKDEDGVVVERNGKFEFVKVSDLTPEERAAHGLEPTTGNSSSSSSSSSVSSTSSSGSMQPTPPSHPRPATATGSSGSRRKIANSSGTQRARSAGTQRQSNGFSVEHDPFDSANYQGHSQYGLTPEQIEYKKEHSRLHAQQRKEQEEQRKERERQKREDAESAFQAWLEKKREEEDERKKEEREKRKQEGENKDERDAQGAYKSWLKCKKTQKRKENKEYKQRTEEHENGFALREREECERAFKDKELSNSNGSISSGNTQPMDHKEWLKKKSSQLKAHKQMSRSQNLRRKLEARKSRKSQNLAKAIRQAQTYRYTDYYGYRY